MNDFSLISGRHAVEEALEDNRTIEKIFLAKGTKGPFEKYIRHSARERVIPLAYVDKAKLDKLSRSNHQGIVAYITSLKYYNHEVLIPHLMENFGNPLVVMVDGVTDVRNIGALARSCEVLGASALIVPTERSAMLNEFAMKTSAGALMHLPVCRTHSLINTTNYLVQCGFEVIGLDGSGSCSIDSSTDGTRPVALVLGDEELGIRKPLLELCEKVAKINQTGKTESLNVSVAGGIAIYEITKLMRGIHQ